jgi:hypothetical protein
MQVPALQRLPGPHELPQPPQLASSVCGLTHIPPQLICGAMHIVPTQVLPTQL